MAKKGQPAQLQVEVNNDDEWEKLLQRDGLILVDIYSEWCGPCLGMQANVRKIKLEFGGDLLQLAVAKSDGITALARFRNKSEPTWMFISKGKMIALLFGANAPQLRTVILEELKKEQAQMEGQPTDRVPLEITDLAEEERVRYEALETKEREMREKEERKKAKELLDRRTKECENILINLPNYGVALIFPSARDTYKAVLNDILDEAGLVIHQTEKINFDENTIKDLCFFTEVSEEFSEESLEELTNEQSIMILFKIAARAEIDDIDEAILIMIYGHTKQPPGAPDSIAHTLNIEVEEVEEKVKEIHVGIWAPRSAQVRATALRMFFPKISADFHIPEPPPEPEHLAIIFPLYKKDQVLQVVQQYPKEIMKYGVFTSEDPEETVLVAKTFKKLDKVDPKTRTYKEKLVFQISKQKSEFVLQLAQLTPLYMSPNAKEGKLECLKFFPDEYDVESEGEEEEEEVEDLAKPTEDEDHVEGQVETEEPKGSEEEELTETEAAEETEVEGSTTPGEHEGELTPGESADAVEEPSSEIAEPPAAEG